MTIAQELDDQYGVYSARCNARHTKLAKAAGNIASGFIKYLGLTIPTWNKGDGTVGGDRVRLGVGEPESFEEKTWTQLSSMNDGSIHFSLSYTLASAATFRAFHVIFELSIRIEDVGYRVTIKHRPKAVLLTADQVENQDFDTVYEEIVSGIRFCTDPASVVIPQPAE